MFAPLGVLEQFKLSWGAFKGITLGPPEGIFETPEVVLGGIFGSPRSELKGQLGVILSLLG